MWLSATQVLVMGPVSQIFANVVISILANDDIIILVLVATIDEM